MQRCWVTKLCLERHITCLLTPDGELKTHHSMDTNSIQFGESIGFIDITYRGRNDSKVVVTAKLTPAGVTACKPGNPEHNTQSVGSLTGWAVCFPGASAGLNLPGSSSGFRSFQAVGLGSFLFCSSASLGLRGETLSYFELFPFLFRELPCRM